MKLEHAQKVLKFIVDEYNVDMNELMKGCRVQPIPDVVKIFCKLSYDEICMTEESIAKLINRKRITVNSARHKADDIMSDKCFRLYYERSRQYTKSLIHESKVYSGKNHGLPWSENYHKTIKS